MADRCQLNFRIDPALLEQFKAAAAARGMNSGDFARLAIRLAVEAPLAPAIDDLAERLAPASGDLEARLAVLEQRLADLEQAPAPTPRRPRPAAPSPAPAPLAPAGGDRPVPPPSSQTDTLTTAEAMALAGGKRNAWSGWASRHQPGDVRPVAGRRFELVGKVPSDRGGPDRLLWRLLPAIEEQDA